MFNLKLKIMKYIFLVFAFFLNAQLVSSQIASKVRYLNVVNDKNIRENTEPKNCVSCSENDFIIDGNESKGYVELEFTGVSNYGQPTSIQLIINVSNVEYAESNNGCSVYLGDKKIGNITNVNKNRSFSVELIKSEIAGKNNIKLILRGNGDDGLYVLSKKTGFGAVLKLQY